MTRDLLKSNFLMLCYGAMMIFLYPILVFPKGELELLINKYHPPFLDVFFKYITHLGDGNVLAILLVVLLFINYSSSIIAAFSIVLQAIVVSLFKRWLYKGLERPLAFFEDGTLLNFVDGVDVHSYNTFPSGHTATGFALIALLFLFLKHRGVLISSGLFLIAMCIGFSRVYFGAIFGVATVVAGLWIFELIFSTDQIHKFENRSLRNLIWKNKG